MITLPADEKDPNLTPTVMTDQVPSYPVMTPGPCALIGGAPIKMIEELCKKVKHGDSSFHVKLNMPGYVEGAVPITFNLADTYGCHLPKSPAGVKAKLPFVGADYVVWCEPDAIERGMCGIWLYTKAVTDYWEKVNGTQALVATDQVKPPVPGIRHLDALDCAEDLVIAGTVCGVACELSAIIVCGEGAVFVGCMAIPLATFAACEAVAAAKAAAECFPGDAEVLKLNEGKVLISEIKVGDQVATAITKNGDLLFESVYFLGHDEADAYSLFFHIEMELVDKKSGNASYAELIAVEMTPFHFVPVKSVSSRHWVNTRAMDVSIGDLILASSQDQHQQQALLPHTVTQKTIVMKYGLFNPYTMSGRILVNNVSVSSHSEWILDPFFDALGLTSWLPSVYQIMLSPLRVMVYVLGPNLYAKTSIATHLTKAITGGSGEEMVVFPSWTVKNVCVPLSLLVTIWFLAQRKGKKLLNAYSAQL
eukprot:CAMPEP_0172423370 /NCGR_PEP_ID=MMETSP1064-20121228/15667_1 /TAXON_ID=202472 /ORGANISM="Aulacoseira subarctica , Strain CCAP 1002/5" /LENGTH=477 /DNA_ID=CAMNT_0013164715 /DNA_START=32 /DNA_END=1465 /DNA_ORIENTATION=+